MKIRIVIVITALFLLSLSAPFDSMAAGEDWKKEFQRICSTVEVAGELKPEEVRKLISDSDALLKLFESRMSADRQMKVYSFRLKKCRDFYKYVYELRKNKSK